MARKHENGGFSLKKTDGVAGSGTYLAVGDQINLPFLGVAPFNPDAISRPKLGNMSWFKSLKFLDKKAPGFTIASVLKINPWATHKFFNSLVLSWDTNNNSDEFAANINDGTESRQYVGSRCYRITTMNSSASGLVLVTLDFLSVYGDNEGGAVTFSAATTVAGQGTGADEIGFNSTIDGVRAHSFQLIREQIPDYVSDNTRYAKRIESKGFMGTFTVQRDRDGTTAPVTGGATARYGTTPNGIQFVMSLDKNQTVYPLDPTILGTETRDYELFNTAGGSNITISSF